MNEKILDLTNHDLGGYHLIKEIGRGNNGIVYLARQVALERLVACKVLLPERVAEPGFVDDFFREARHVAKLNHPNVVQALDVGITSEGWYYFVMEYVEGKTLENLRLNHPEEISLKFILEITLKLAGALDYAWSRFQMIHGDIKPENLLIRNEDKTVKLADLGLAKIGSSDNHNGEIMLTPLYAAPEVVMQNKSCMPDVRSDIYSCGVMLFELASGSAPFHGTMEEVLQQHVDTPAPLLLSANPDIDCEFATLIDRMLLKKPEDRPENWHEVREKIKIIYQRLFAPGIRATVAINSQLLRKSNDLAEYRPQLLWPLWIILALLGALAIIVPLIMVL